MGPIPTLGAGGNQHHERDLEQFHIALAHHQLFNAVKEILVTSQDTGHMLSEKNSVQKYSNRKLLITVPGRIKAVMQFLAR